MLKKLKNLAKALLAIELIRKTYEKVSEIHSTIWSTNRVTSVIYYWFGFFNFSREQYSVLYGRRNYYKNLNRERQTRSELRRNVHRLEKALSMRPRWPIFAQDFIGETVEFFEKAVADFARHKKGVDKTELDWSYDVLKEYFAVVDNSDKKVNALRERFAKIEYEPANEKLKPFKRGKPHTNVKYEDLMDLAMQRRSVRWFKQKPVPRELIDKALLVAEQSPSACNRLPYEFRIFDEPDLAKKVAGIPFGTAGYSHQVPTIIVVVGKQDNYFSPRDRHLIYIDASLAVTPFMYALETLGLSSSPINWPDFEPLEKKMQKTIGLRYDERVIMLIAVGYADPEGMIPYSQKKTLDVLRSYNKIGQ